MMLIQVQKTHKTKLKIKNKEDKLKIDLNLVKFSVRNLNQDQNLFKILKILNQTEMK